MAKRPAPRYQPGELDRTRERLGALSPEEAKRMADKLGGDVGTEQADGAIDEKYNKLRERSRSARPVTGTRGKSGGDDQPAPGGSDRTERRRELIRAAGTQGSGAAAGGGSRRLRDAAPPSRLRYLDRVRLDLWSARNGFHLKDWGGAMATMMAFGGRGKDYVNPRFIQDANLLLFDDIEKLVVGCNALSAVCAKGASRRVAGAPSAHSTQILEALSGWDVSTLSSTLAKLQRNPRAVQFHHLRQLLQLVYRPLLLLAQVDDTAAARVLREHFEYAQQVLGDDQLAARRLAGKYFAARDALAGVGDRVSLGLYPALVKLVATRYVSHDELMATERDALLQFVGVSADQLVPAVAPRPARAQSVPAGHEQPVSGPPGAERTTTAADPPSTPAGATATGTVAAAGQAPPLPPAAQKGAELLELLFPRAGWDRLAAFPDLYAYFQPLFDYPRGFELISRADPLHQLLICVSIVGDLLPAFRRIKFGAVPGEEDLPLLVSTMAEQWHLFSNEVYGGMFVPRLVDYCKNLERERDYANTTLALKARDEINWMRRAYFLPHLSFSQTFPVDAVVRRELPRFHKAVSELRRGLGQAARSLDTAVRAGKASGTSLKDVTCPAVDNPWEEITFDIENPVAKRLKLILRQRATDAEGRVRIVNKFNNANLIFHMLSLLGLLDFLVNDRQSYLYNAPGGVLFRSIDDENETPSYTVELRDHGALLSRVGDAPEQLAAELQTGQDKVERDPLTGLRSGTSRFELFAAALRSAGTGPLSVISVSISGFADYSEQRGRSAGDELLRRTARLVAEQAPEDSDAALRLQADEFLILRPAVSLPLALESARELAGAARDAQPPLPVNVGVLQLQRGWALDDVLERAAAARAAAAGSGSRVAFIEPETGDAKPLA